MTKLFSPTTVGPWSLPNRIVLAPMTRARAAQPGDVPHALMAEYYAARASAGLLVSEATQISRQGQGYSHTPGIYTEAQIEGWKLVTDAVHRAGGRMFLQLWHVGRMSHPSFHEDGLPVAPSALEPGASVWILDPATGVGGMQPAPVPRELRTEEIPGIVADYRRAAENAMRAGFDGVEIHGANGYLIDQFLRRSANRRTDAYGGAIENRIRFAVEVATAVASAIGPERTGIRLSPFIKQRGMDDDEITVAILELARKLDGLGLAYLHLVEADWSDAPTIPEEFRVALRAAFSRRLIVAGKYDAARAEKILGDGLADLVAFGRSFLANPDLPRRLAEGLPLADFDPRTLFGGGAEGYTSYPKYEAQ